MSKTRVQHSFQRRRVSSGKFSTSKHRLLIAVSASPEQHEPAASNDAVNNSRRIAPVQDEYVLAKCFDYRGEWGPRLKVEIHIHVSNVGHKRPPPAELLSIAPGAGARLQSPARGH
jgi:hypothetical protein